MSGLVALDHKTCQVKSAGFKVMLLKISIQTLSIPVIQGRADHITVDVGGKPLFVPPMAIIKAELLVYEPQD
jgi:hypothetical protein